MNKKLLVLLIIIIIILAVSNIIFAKLYFDSDNMNKQIAKSVLSDSCVLFLYGQMKDIDHEKIRTFADSIAEKKLNGTYTEKDVDPQTISNILKDSGIEK